MFSNNHFKKEKGQTLVEVLVVLAVAAIMIVSLIGLVLISLKNATLAQNQTKATKLSQDAIDKIRILRDDNIKGNLINPYDVTVFCAGDLWSVANFNCGVSACYYKLGSNGDDEITLSLMHPVQEPGIDNEYLGDGFKRYIEIQPSGNEAKLIVQVTWSDSSGDHNSNLETIITKPNYECKTE